ncbi:hypothetical protein HO133_009959 [Letharia lupina]|uniref:C2H2-type domain-containing protein n=1 Tax=Letharia lupina TaxID=560253 RepID=A0A8H6FDW1_9LECA|nr:uncharacterized protein HO133_009959 [Letharia lupina]KAF6224765.1 hypothetical protein HO133_009959 [Letharia lupina]
MNQQFSNAPIYAPIYPPNQQQSTPSSRPQSHGAPQQNLPAAHTLPPLTSGNHAASAYGNDTYPTRTQPLQPSLMTAPHGQDSQPGSYPVYAPTANTFYNGQSASFSQASQNQHLHQQSRPSPVTGLHQPVYSSAPTQGRLPDLRRIQPRENGKPSLSLADHINQLDAVEEPQPTHVVGSQGRRGILPSAAGRPAAVAGANTSGQKAAPTPPKDAEGKYPCPHCNKNYLHAKHLKRHLLRHTGVRPYTCGLCKDTFSRSDILKRHFQKCSVRRGNPSGESHLSHSRANKKSRQEDAARMESSTPTGVSQAQQMEVFTPTSLDGSFDINTLNLGQSQYVESSDQVSRSNSIKKSKRSTGSHSNRASLGLVNTSGYDPTSYGYVSGHVTPDSATTSGAATPYTYLHESRSNQISPSGAYSTANGSDMVFAGVSRAPTSSNYNNGSLPHIAGQRSGHDIDWPSFSNYNSNDDYGNTQYHSGTNTPLHPIKSEADLHNIQIGDYPYLQSKA